MVDFARIQNRIYYGYGKAALKLGTTHAIYRPTTPFDPIHEDNFVDNRLISIDQDYTYAKTKKYGDPTWQFLPADGLTLQNFDYMVGSQTTYFIIDIAPDGRLSPPVCVECNATITITRPTSINPPKTNLVPGKNPYQSYKPGSPKTATNLPCSLLQHGKSDSNTLKLPTSVKLPFYSILIPELDSLEVKTDDVIEDDAGRRLSVISAERTRTTLGFRIIASEQGT